MRDVPHQIPPVGRGHNDRKVLEITQQGRGVLLRAALSSSCSAPPLSLLLFPLLFPPSPPHPFYPLFPSTLSSILLLCLLPLGPSR